MRASLFHLDDVVWQNDLAVLRSWKAHIPWEHRFGKGKLKVLRFNLDTEAGTYLMHWPEGYDPLRYHGHRGDEELMVLEGDFRWEGKTLGPGTYMFLPKGQKHGLFVPGPDGCLFLVSVNGPLFDQDFEQEMLALGKAPRRRT